MKRTEALKKLKSLIPSFGREYVHWEEIVDKEADKSWLYRDKLEWDENNNLVEFPEVIPADYMVGLRCEDGGEEYTTFARTDDDKGRKIGLSIVDYGMYGNTHKYGTLYVSGVSWKNVNTGAYRFSTTLSKVDLHAKTSWEVDIFKIAGPEDTMKGNWYEYEAGEATQRFESLEELYCTAAYVSLLRYDGPIYLFAGSLCIVPEKDDYLLTVDADDNVEFCPTLKRAIKEMEKN